MSRRGWALFVALVDCQDGAHSREVLSRSRASCASDLPPIVSKCTDGQDFRVPVGTLTGMGRGIGKTQQAILAELTALTDHGWPSGWDKKLDIAELVKRIGRSDRQIRTAVRSLERRGLVAVTREHLGWTGIGEYGREELRDGSSYRPPHGPEIPTSRVIRKGEPWHRGRDQVATGNYELVRGGMPTWGLAVWLREKRIAYLEEIRQQWGRLNHPPHREEYERLTGHPVP
jgi:hypothetical protein